jgi:hypothetical protein
LADWQYVNLFYLYQLSDVFRKLGSEFPDLKIIVVADKRFRHRWREYRKPSLVRGNGSPRHTGHGYRIMPLEENDWSRGKCGLKLLQYMACGIPVVCSSVAPTSTSSKTAKMVIWWGGLGMASKTQGTSQDDAKKGCNGGGGKK